LQKKQGTCDRRNGHVFVHTYKTKEAADAALLVARMDEWCQHRTNEHDNRSLCCLLYFRVTVALETRNSIKHEDFYHFHDDITQLSRLILHSLLKKFLK